MSEQRFANGQYSAPELKFNGDKFQGNEATNQFYQIPQYLADIINRELGNSSAQLKIMNTLVGTKEGFHISEKWMLDRTGLAHSSYIEARKKLIEKGWLSLDAYKTITVNFDEIHRQGKAHSDS